MLADSVNNSSAVEFKIQQHSQLKKVGTPPVKIKLGL